LVESTPTRTSVTAEAGSFRDWDGRVFSLDGRIVRGLTSAGLADWEALRASELYATFTAAGELVETTAESAETLELLRGVDPAVSWAAALGHERIPFLSYPFEWTFSMLQDAALLQLRLTAAALEEGLILKDATPYNVQWRGAQPVFIDIGSFERARPGEPWAGYRQFCMLYLYPLLLESVRGAPFQPWLRGSVDGIPPLEFRKLFTYRDSLRRGMFRHVLLHAALERRHRSRGSEIRRELEQAGFDPRVVQATVAQLTRLVGRLRSRAREDSSWKGYRETCSYTDDDARVKEEVVRRAAAALHRRLVWDLGANDGRYSRIASDHADVTVAFDSDAAVVDGLYRSLRDEGNTSIVPLLVDLADPSPAIGWRNRERVNLPDRGRPDLALCLALVHHLSIGRNIPLRELVDWLRSLDCELVVEFPDRSDPMVEQLLAPKRGDAHPDYARETFETHLHERFDVQEVVELPSGTRLMYRARPR
jgi:hypothetical protein